MTNTINAIDYRIVLSIPGEMIRRSRLMFHPDLRGSGGIDPKNLKRSYPAHCRKLPVEWLREAEKEEPFMGNVIMVSYRNLIQNARCVAFTRHLGLCESADEHASRSMRPFRGISFLRNGTIRADVYWPGRGMADDVEQFGGGIPVLWDGLVLTLDEMITEVCDFAHLWSLQINTTGESPVKEASLFERLQRVFEEVRHADALEARDRLLEEVRALSRSGSPLLREKRYLHTLLGSRQDGGPVAGVAHGSLEEIGEIARRAGAVSAVVVDNGGSSWIGQRRGPNAELRTLVESYYHRPPAVAVAIFELKGEPSTTFFQATGLLEERPTHALPPAE